MIYTQTFAGTITEQDRVQVSALHLDPSQTATVLFETNSSNLQVQVELRAPDGTILGNAAAHAPSQQLLLQTLPIAEVGTYEVEVATMAGTGTYKLELTLNAAVESEDITLSDNGSIVDAQNLTSSFITLDTNAQRAAVRGTITGSDTDIYRLPLASGDSTSVILYGSGLNISLHDHMGTVLANGVTGDANTTLITNFTLPSTDDYYVQVNGDTIDHTQNYTAVITSNAALQLPATDPQPLPASGVLLGYLDGVFTQTATMETHAVTTLDGIEDNDFGSATAIYDNILVIGAPRQAMNDSQTGAVYVYERLPGTDGTWSQTATLAASDGLSGDRFGDSVAIWDQTIIIGSKSSNNSRDVFSGATYIFDRNTTGDWIQTAKLTPDDGADGDKFGAAVAIHGDIAVIGASRDSTEITQDTGSAYIFERTSSDGQTTWTQTAKLTANDGASGDRFGIAVTVWGSTAIIGARADETQFGGPRSGSAYVFERDAAGQWIESSNLTPAQAMRGDFFGTSVSIWQDTILVGAVNGQERYGDLADTGAAHVFERNSDGHWIETAKLLASDANEYAHLGISVNLWGDRAVIGADGDPNNGADTGAAYIFERDQTGNWGETTKLIASNGQPGSRLGYATAVNNDTVIMGGLYDDTVSLRGVTYLFTPSFTDKFNMDIIGGSELTLTLDAPFGDLGAPGTTESMTLQVLDSSGSLIASDDNEDGVITDVNISNPDTVQVLITGEITEGDYVLRVDRSQVSSISNLIIGDDQAARSIKYFDDDGTAGMVTYTGGTATVTLSGTGLEDIVELERNTLVVPDTVSGVEILQIDIHVDSDANINKRNLILKAKGGDDGQVRVGSVIADGDMGRIDARGSNFIAADITIDGFLGQIWSNDLDQVSLIIGDHSSGKPTRLKFADATNLVVDSAAPIDLVGNKFVNDDPATDGVTALYVKNIRIKQQAAFAIDTTGFDHREYSVGKIKIGDITGGVWTGTNNFGTLSAQSIDNLHAYFSGSYKSVQSKQNIENTVISGIAILKIDAKGDIRNSDFSFDDILKNLKSKGAITDVNVTAGSGTKIEARNDMVNMHVNLLGSFDPINPKAVALKRLKAGGHMQAVVVKSANSIQGIEARTFSDSTFHIAVDHDVATNLLMDARNHFIDTAINNATNTMAFVGSFKVKGDRESTTWMNNVQLASPRIDRAIFGRAGANEGNQYGASYLLFKSLKYNALIRSDNLSLKNVALITPLGIPQVIDADTDLVFVRI